MQAAWDAQKDARDAEAAAKAKADDVEATLRGSQAALHAARGELREAAGVDSADRQAEAERRREEAQQAVEEERRGLNAAHAAAATKVAQLEERLAAATTAEEAARVEGMAQRTALGVAEARVCELLETHAWERSRLKQAVDTAQRRCEALQAQAEAAAVSLEGLRAERDALTAAREALRGQVGGTLPLGTTVECSRGVHCEAIWQCRFPLGVRSCDPTSITNPSLTRSPRLRACQLGESQAHATNAMAQFAQLQRGVEERAAKLEASTAAVVAERDAVVAERDQLRGLLTSAKEQLQVATQRVETAEGALVLSEARVEATAAQKTAVGEQLLQTRVRVEELEAAQAVAVVEREGLVRRVESLQEECEELGRRLAQAEQADGEGGKRGERGGEGQGEAATRLLVEGLRQSMAEGNVERDRLRELVQGLKRSVAGGNERISELREQVRCRPCTASAPYPVWIRR